mmetsp:Transcript_2892/g.8829  ORF Transcript_2892/g.8829 Transcript_2892/m.8829 type:complete len:200 (-) Transcript_2892:249-848(-)
MGRRFDGRAGEETMSLVLSAYAKSKAVPRSALTSKKVDEAIKSVDGEATTIGQCTAAGGGGMRAKPFAGLYDMVKFSVPAGTPWSDSSQDCNSDTRKAGTPITTAAATVYGCEETKSFSACDRREYMLRNWTSEAISPLVAFVLELCAADSTIRACIPIESEIAARTLEETAATCSHTDTATRSPCSSRRLRSILCATR